MRRAYPEAMEECRRIYGDTQGLVLCEDAEAALEGADCLAVVTEWREFRSPDFEHVKAQLAEPVIFDGRNLYEPGYLEAQGFQYYAIGRGQSVSGSA